MPSASITHCTITRGDAITRRVGGQSHYQHSKPLSVCRAPCRFLDLVLQYVDKDQRVALMRVALAGGKGEIPGTDAGAIISTATQFIDDMEDQTIVADRWVWERGCNDWMLSVCVPACLRVCVHALLPACCMCAVCTSC